MLIGPWPGAKSLLAPIAAAGGAAGPVSGDGRPTATAEPNACAGCCTEEVDATASNHVSPTGKTRALNALEAAGLITVIREQGRPSLVSLVSQAYFPPPPMKDRPPERRRSGGMSLVS
jgi:hypothetical protein